MELSWSRLNLRGWSVLPTPYKEYDWMGRVDYQASKDRIYARYIRQTINEHEC